MVRGLSSIDKTAPLTQTCSAPRLRSSHHVFIFPINEDGYVGRKPYVIISLAVVNSLALAATYLLASSHAVFSLYGFTPAQPRALTVFSSMFLHAGVLHLVGNMFFLWMFGYRIENTFGRWLFGLVYLLCGCGAAGLHYLFNTASTIPCIGASGAISGIMGCYFVLFPRSRFDIEVFFLRFHVTSIPTHTQGAIGTWVAEQAALGLLTQTARFSSTAFWAHVGGFGTGVLTTLVLLLFIPQLRRRGDQPFIVRSVKGAVHDVNGNVLPNARFELQSDSGKVVAALADTKGRFAITSISDGCYSFNVSRGGWQTIRGNIVVKKSTRYNVPIKIRMSQQIPESLPVPKPQLSVPRA
jgi:membrane associated rhomboid family serine protease